jgi:hypothetical protein
MFGYVFGLGFVLQVLAIVVWARRGGDRIWIWIIIFGGVVGAAAYFLVEGLPDLSTLADSFHGPGRRRRITALRALIRDNPSAGNYEELGELLIQEEKWAEARKAFDAAIATRTDLIDPFYWRGVAAFELNDDVAAIADLQRVVAVDPKFAYSRALCVLGQALAQSGRTDEATRVFDRLVKSTTSTEALVIAAEFYFVEQRFADARALVDNVLARRESMPAYQRQRDRPWLRKAKGLERKMRKVGPATTEARSSP